MKSQKVVTLKVSMHIHTRELVCSYLPKERERRKCGSIGLHISPRWKENRWKGSASITLYALAISFVMAMGLKCFDAS